MARTTLPGIEGQSFSDFLFGLFVGQFLRLVWLIAMWLNLVVASSCPSMLDYSLFNLIYSFTLFYRLVLSNDILTDAY